MLLLSVPTLTEAEPDTGAELLAGTLLEGCAHWALVPCTPVPGSSPAVVRSCALRRLTEGALARPTIMHELPAAPLGAAQGWFPLRAAQGVSANRLPRAAQALLIARPSARRIPRQRAAWTWPPQGAPQPAIHEEGGER